MINEHDDDNTIMCVCARPRLRSFLQILTTTTVCVCDTKKIFSVIVLIYYIFLINSISYHELFGFNSTNVYYYQKNSIRKNKTTIKCINYYYIYVLFEQ